VGFTLDFIVMRGAGRRTGIGYAKSHARMVSADHQLLPHDQSEELICMGFNNRLTNWLFRTSSISVNI